ncbi:hypothetical protein PR002_g7544 [Phytophthora rubi]|uniref:Uncharacterized protein n=1 Tax=Phytophthora rubi TaxID=129364 RepID=A0A6A3MUZ5_9STRA|nr:hypothetical protein PR002_g7544 [Phytophthora rubi]
MIFRGSGSGYRYLNPESPRAFPSLSFHNQRPRQDPHSSSPQQYNALQEERKAYSRSSDTYYQTHKEKARES